MSLALLLYRNDLTSLMVSKLVSPLFPPARFSTHATFLSIVETVRISSRVDDILYEARYELYGLRKRT